MELSRTGGDIPERVEPHWPQMHKTSGKMSYEDIMCLSCGETIINRRTGLVGFWIGCRTSIPQPAIACIIMQNRLHRS